MEEDVTEEGDGCDEAVVMEGIVGVGEARMCGAWMGISWMDMFMDLRGERG